MIILASKSPRRKELLSLITDDFTVDSAEVDETLPCDIEPDKAVEYLSKIKAQPFRKSGKIVIGADTVVNLFKSIGMKSSMVSFSTPNKDILKQIADRFNSKDYLIVSYEMETLHTGEAEYYQVTMVIKSKRNNDEGHLLSLIQEFPDVTVQRIE